MKKTCLVCALLSEDAQNKIRRMLHDYEVIMCCDPELFNFTFDTVFSLEELRRANIIIGTPNVIALSNCENLEWLQTISSVADPLTKSGLLDSRTTLVTTARGVFDDTLSDFMVGAVYNYRRNFYLFRDLQQKRIWSYESSAKPVNKIAGSNVLVVGLGHIGSAFAKKMYALGANIYGIRQNITQKPTYVKEIYTLDSLNDILRQMDYVALCLPDMPRPVLAKEQFKLMKATALIINTARGGLINTDDLAEALHNKEIGGAVLDATIPNPLPNNHSLWQEENCILTFHNGSGYGIEDMRQMTEEIILTNVRNYLNGDDLLNLVKY